AAARLVLTGSATQAAGTSQNVSLRALDAFGNTATAYTGAHDITFSGASSSTAPLTAPTVGGTVFGAPASLVFANGVSTPNALVLYRAETAQIAATDDTIAAGDAGTHTLPGVVLRTAGPQTITATDTVVGSIAGTTPAIAVAPAATVTFAVTNDAAAPQVAGQPFSVTVTARDAFGNT